MFENPIDLAGYDLLWRNKPDLPVANEENKKLEEMLKEKKIEMEKLKVVLQSNINKGKNIREHCNDLFQTLSYKQQLYKSREHQLEMEVHAEKLLDRECSRLQQEKNAINSEINTLRERQKRREIAIAEQEEKKENLKLSIEWDEEALLKYLEKSTQIEKDNMALLKYTSEDDSKINELGLLIERLSREVYEKKSVLEDANTEALMVQSELDHMQEEFQNAYNDRMSLINNWEKSIKQIQQRNKEITKLSEYLTKQRAEEVLLRRNLKEQDGQLAIEHNRNNELESEIRQKDDVATKLRNNMKLASGRQEDLNAEIATVRNVLNNLRYQKQTVQNSLKQIEKQMQQKVMKFADIQDTIRTLEGQIETLAKETFEADHYTKELDGVLERENRKNARIQGELAHLTRDILVHDTDLNDTRTREKEVENHVKNCQAEIRNLIAKLIVLDQVRAKQESEMYQIDSGLEKIRQRVKKMSGETNEEERRKVETEKALLLAALEDRKEYLALLTEDLKVMMDKINVYVNELDSNRKLNTELIEKTKFLEFFISNSQKSLKCSVSRKQELLVQECLERYQMKRYKKLLSNKNKSVASLQKSKHEFETIMKERTEELKHCDSLLLAEIRSESEECSLVKKKCKECQNKVLKYQAKYKVILDSMGILEPGTSVVENMLLKGEDEKSDLQSERDKLLTRVLKNDEELSALRNTVWLIHAANEQFRQALHPPGISLEDSELLQSTEEEDRSLVILLHARKLELRSLGERVQEQQQELEQALELCRELEEAMADRVSEAESLDKELSDLGVKIQRAERSESRLKVDVRDKNPQSRLDDDIRIHILREIRRNVSDLLFSAVETMPDVSSKIQELYQQASIPLPARACSSASLRSASSSGIRSRASSALSITGSGRSSRSEVYSPSIVKLDL